MNKDPVLKQYPPQNILYDNSSLGVSRSRESSIELLRIICMLMVMLLHVNYIALGVPSLEELNNYTLETVIRILGESMTIIAVNVFVLISGWFGIHFKFIRLLELVFQTIFICLVVDLYLGLISHQIPLTLGVFRDLFLLSDEGYWFVRSYIVLYVLSPALNSLVESIDKRRLRWLLIILFFVQTLQGCMTYNRWYDFGYSPLFFVFLYFLGRYMRLYPSWLTTRSKMLDFSVYFSFSMLTIGCTYVYIFTGWHTGYANIMSPFIIIASIYFFLIFTKLHFTNKPINWIAVSSLAVYLLHGQFKFMDKVYCENIRQWASTCSHLDFIFYTSSMVIGLFLAAILLDKVRIFLWQHGVLTIIRKLR